MNDPVRYDGGLLTKPYYIADARRISDLPGCASQTKVGKQIAWEDRGNALNGAFLLPNLRFTQGKKGMFDHLLQVLLRGPLASGFGAN